MNYHIPHDKTLVTIPIGMDCRPWNVHPPKGYESGEIRIRNLKIIDSCGGIIFKGSK